MTRPGRNDLCPCGSNRKFKRCCGASALPRTPNTLQAAPSESVRASAESFLHGSRAEVLQLIEKAMLFKQQGKLHQAAVLCRKVLDVDQSNVDALHLLGVLLSETGPIAEAAVFIERAIKAKPHFPEAYYSLARLMQGQSRFDQAIVLYRQALALRPDFADAYHGLGEVFQYQGHLGEATECYRAAIRYNPELAVSLNNLGNVMKVEGRLDEAASCYQRALDVQPDFAGAHYNLGCLRYDQGSLDAAITCYKNALAFSPPFAASVHYNLAIALSYQGRLDEAIFNYRRALQLQPNLFNSQSGILCALNNMPRFTTEEIYAEHVRFEQQYACTFAGDIRPHQNDKSLDRRLRIGYVSPDLCAHSCAYFFEPLLEQHNHAEFEIFCYAEVAVPDTVTSRLQRLSDHWRNTVGIGDAALAARIRDDRIDILVDLAGHTDKNRLLVFARKPAPIQISWLGYPNTTGLKTIDYRFTDIHADPFGAADRLHSEQLLRLPKGFLCYRPPQDCPSVDALPAGKAGYITFASFNAAAKISSEVVGVWSRILNLVPGARLALKAKSFLDSATRDRYKVLFAENGISSERIDLLKWQASTNGHLNLYNQVDIGLDPFPYNGTTTTCEALWMGVPVVTLRGDRHSARVGTSLLMQVGLEDLIAESATEYVNKAVALAADRQRLQDTRLSLRSRVERSPLCDATGFAREVEAVYRVTWRKWCGT